ERRALARRPSRAAFDKLLRDPHPMVVKNLLQNPRLTEDDVIRMVARRPAYPEVIAEVARHPVWSQRARVRMAIVQNPGAPPELAVPLLRLLVRPELQQVTAAADVPASGHLENGHPIPPAGAGFVTYSTLGSALGRQYVHGAVRDLLLESLAACA